MSKTPPSLYDQFFTPEERRDLKDIPPGDLIGDIDLQRIVLVIIHAAEAPDSLDFQQILARKHAENAANSALLTLVNTHIRHNDPHADLADILEQAYQIAARQMDVPNYLSQAQQTNRTHADEEFLSPPEE